MSEIKRFAKIAGEMVSLGKVEDVIGDLWPEYSHLVVSVPDERKGEQLVLITTKTDAGREDMAAYFRQCGLTELGVPRRILVCEKLPLLATGKADYQKAREMALAS